MKTRTKTFYRNAVLLLLVLLLAGCTSETDGSSKTNTSENEPASQPENKSDAPEESNETDKKPTDSETPTDQTNGTSSAISQGPKKEGSNNKSGKRASLSQYSSQEIEYARVWKQLGPNQEIDELNVRQIPAGTPLNPNDATSGNYPENVIQLTGSRLADGSVTYSGNGNGTIHVYNVPLRWDGRYPAGEKFYKDMIENTKLVYVDPGDNEEILKLIDKLNSK